MNKCCLGEEPWAQNCLNSHINVMYNTVSFSATPILRSDGYAEYIERMLAKGGLRIQVLSGKGSFLESHRVMPKSAMLQGIGAGRMNEQSSHYCS